CGWTGDSSATTTNWAVGPGCPSTTSPSAPPSRPPARPIRGTSWASSSSARSVGELAGLGGTCPRLYHCPDDPHAEPDHHQRPERLVRNVEEVVDRDQPGEDDRDRS